MARTIKRKEFSPKQKAEIFKRDRATCAFSGKSLWALDYGACPLFQWDWVDHDKPSTRGGGNELSNGICVSYTYNLKKRANGADRFLLTDPDMEGTPSENYFYYFGRISDDWHKQLIRLAAINEIDWYFNRAVSHLIHACYLAYRRRGYSRKPKKYRDSALRKFDDFRRLGGTSASLIKRGLVLHPKREDVRLLLSMSEPITKTEFDKKLSRLKTIYAVNAKVMNQFWNATTVAGMRKVVTKTAHIHEITPAVRESLESHLRFWKADPRQ